MRSFTFSLTVLIATFLLNACNPKEEKPNTEDMISKANQLDIQYVEAFNNGDSEALMKLYWKSPDLYSYMPGSMQYKGYKETRKATEEEFKNNKGAKLELIESKNDVHGDVVVGHGLFIWTLEMENGESIISKGRYTDVKAMKEGKMVYIIDHASVPLPPLPSSQE